MSRVRGSRCQESGEIELRIPYNCPDPSSRRRGKGALRVPYIRAGHAFFRRAVLSDEAGAAVAFGDAQNRPVAFVAVDRAFLSRNRAASVGGTANVLRALGVGDAGAEPVFAVFGETALAGAAVGGGVAARLRAIGVCLANVAARRTVAVGPAKAVRENEYRPALESARAGLAFETIDTAVERKVGNGTVDQTKIGAIAAVAGGAGRGGAGFAKRSARIVAAGFFRGGIARIDRRADITKSADRAVIARPGGAVADVDAAVRVDTAAHIAERAIVAIAATVDANVAILRADLGQWTLNIFRAVHVIDAAAAGGVAERSRGTIRRRIATDAFLAEPNRVAEFTFQAGRVALAMTVAALGVARKSGRAVGIRETAGP